MEIYKKEINVLDHGRVKYVDHMGTDNSSLFAARMSTDNPTGVDDSKDDRLRKFLWTHGHTSPTEMAELVVEIQCPLFVMRQLDRHRTVDYANDLAVETVDEIPRKFMSRNEFSGRYSVMPDLFYVPTVDRVRGSHVTNKQSSGDELPLETQTEFVKMVTDLSNRALEDYTKAIETGVSRELARILLPSNKYSRIMLKGSLLSWLKFLKLRDQEDVQWETRQYAIALATIIKDLFPKSYKVFYDHTQQTTSLSPYEKDLLKSILDEVMWLGGVTDKTMAKTILAEALSKLSADNLAKKLKLVV